MEKAKQFFLVFLEVFKDKIFIYLALADIVLILVLWFFWVKSVAPSGMQVYSPIKINFGENLDSYSFPVIVSLFFLVNFILGAISRRREALASYLALGSSLFIVFLSLVLLRHYLSLI